MMQGITPVATNETSRWQINVQAEVLSAEVARRKANGWLLMNAGNLLRADNPELVIKESLLWRVDILLTLPGHGVVGRIGQLYLDAITGEALPTDNLVDELNTNAQAITPG